jgi:hypothetical protein
MPPPAKNSRNVRVIKVFSGDSVLDARADVERCAPTGCVDPSRDSRKARLFVQGSAPTPMRPRFLLAALVAPVLLQPAAAQEAGRPRNGVVDVQIGEKGEVMRVALVCRNDCAVGARAGGVFHLPGVVSNLAIDLAGRSKNAKSLTFKPVEGGSDLNIVSSKALSKAAIRGCKVDGQPASCIDLEFVKPGSRDDIRAEPVLAVVQPLPIKPRLAPRSDAARDRRVAGAASASGGRAVGSFAPPERLDPPKDALTAAARLATAAAPPLPPALRLDRATSLLGPSTDILKEAKTILGRSLGIAECEAAAARLRADAWALDAMVDVGFCSAARGALADADSTFVRLLDYTPDNYAALVGRALIAAKSGERAVARKYFQDALNVPPPMEESNRIVAAMASL